MLGHQLWRQLNPAHEVWVTLRKPVSHYAQHRLFEVEHAISGVDVLNSANLSAAIDRVRPNAVINCVGIIKQLDAARNPLISLSINSLLPHQLAQMCAAVGSRLIHISTDCVFSGRKGNYTEQDVSDAEDLYGRTKYLGEVQGTNCVTLRTSIIGRELETKSGLIEWFLGQNGHTINGFRRAIYSGFTTPVLCRVIEDVLMRHSELSGVWQVSSDPINKYELLLLAQRAFLWQGDIKADDTFVCDRSLDSTRFREQTGFRSPSWENMLTELASVAR